MWMQQSRICTLAVLQEMQVCVQMFSIVLKYLIISFLFEII